MNIFSIGNWSEVYTPDRIRFLSGMFLAQVSLSPLIPLAYKVGHLALEIFLNPKDNVTVTHMLACVGFAYLTYELTLLAKIVAMKSLSILFGPNAYTPLSFHGWEFEWLQPEIKHPDPTLHVYADQKGKLVATYTYPLPDSEQEIQDEINDIKQQ